MRRAATLVAGSCAIAAAACGESETALRCDARADGVRVVVSRGPGAWERQGLSPRLEELWRAGGLAEGEELAYPGVPAAGASGRLAIPDAQLAEVVVIDADGNWLGPWGRRGPGPGELSFPAATAWDAAGRRLIVFDVGASKVLFLEDGEASGPDLPVSASFTGALVRSGQLPWAGVQPDGAVLARTATERVQDAEAGTAISRVLRLAPGAASPETVAAAVTRTIAEGPYAGWALPGWPRLMASSAGAGFVVGGAAAEYRFTVYDARGRPLHEVCREAAPLPITGSERGPDAGGETPAPVADLLRHAPPPAVPAAFGRFFAGAGGRVWVQRERPSALDGTETFYGVAGARYDVFDAAGAYLGEIRAPAGARFQAAAGDTVWAFEFGELDETWVVAYRLRVQ